MNGVAGTSVMLFVGTTFSPTITDPSVILGGSFKDENYMDFVNIKMYSYNVCWFANGQCNCCI